MTDRANGGVADGMRGFVRERRTRSRRCWKRCALFSLSPVCPATDKAMNLHGKHHNWCFIAQESTSPGPASHERGFPHVTPKKVLDRQLFRRRMWSKVVESGKT